MGKNYKRGGLAKLRAVHVIGNQLSLTTHFTTEECRSLVQLYIAITNIGKLDRIRCRDFLYNVFDICTDLMLDLTFRAFDRDCDGVLGASEFVTGLSIILRGTLLELIEFTYMAYDMNGDKSLGREELFQCLKGCLTPGYGMDTDDIEDGERDVVELLMKKLDVNKDGQITYDDFEQAVIADPLLLQSLGQCLPNPRQMAVFLATFTEDYRTYHSDFKETMYTRGMKRRQMSKLKPGSNLTSSTRSTFRKV